MIILQLYQILYMRYRPKFRLDGHTDSVTAMEFSPNGLFLASAGVDGRLFVWSSDNGKCLQEVTQVSAGFSSLVWLDNEQILAGKEDGKALLVISSLVGGNAFSRCPLRDRHPDPIGLLHSPFVFSSCKAN
jgi:WD40 repeat protein